MRTIREIPEGTKDFILRMVVVPFEIALALTAMWSGTAGLFNLSITATAFNATLPHWLVTLFNLMYIVAGLGVLSGVGWSYRNAEASGLILMFTSLIVRAGALYVTQGLNSISTNVIIQAVFFGGACVVRVAVLFAKHNTILHPTEKQAVVIESVEQLRNGD